MPSSIKGMVLGLANVMFIALAAGLTYGFGGRSACCYCGPRPPEPDGAFALILTFGSLPAIATGALLGSVAVALGARRPWVRFAVLGGLAAFVVLALGTVAMWFELIPLACVPTLVASAILERWTRPTPVTELPTAYRR